jgi:limonene-1,2-epoxide hydrolase
MTPEQVVRALLAAWDRLDVDEIMSCFASDAVWDNVPIGAVHGTDEIRKAVERYVGPATECRMEILNLASEGDVVLTERVDHFVLGGRDLHGRVMGAFEVDGDTIVAWRDYFQLSPEAVEALRTPTSEDHP